MKRAMTAGVTDDQTDHKNACITEADDIALQHSEHTQLIIIIISETLD
jgi:hypothetical protein